jgi:hypothetical protein
MMPKLGLGNDRITVRVDADVFEAFERFIAQSGVPTRSKQDAYRHVVRDWLGTHGYLKDGAEVLPRRL